MRQGRRAQCARWALRVAESLRAGFVPAGRTQSAAGKALATTLINCAAHPAARLGCVNEDNHLS